jgi:serine/threonine-protein kinase
VSFNSGDTFAGYTIKRMLGAGGMGEVYLAEHPRLTRLDAIKILPAELTEAEEYRARFVREADLAASLWHPHIVGVHDRGEQDGHLWISMDFVDGTDAQQLLRANPGGLSLPEVLDIVDAVADALDFAHQRRLLHRDVKPANILLTPTVDGRRRILLADFGIARRMDESGGLTKTGMTLGTYSYTAPEQLMGGQIDGRADQYSLAATAFQLLTGALLFGADSNIALTISRHLSAEPPRLGSLRPELSALDSAMMRALAKNPVDRFPTCAAFAAALRNPGMRPPADATVASDRVPPPPPDRAPDQWAQSTQLRPQPPEAPPPTYTPPPAYNPQTAYHPQTAYAPPPAYGPQAPGYPPGQPPGYGPPGMPNPNQPGPQQHSNRRPLIWAGAAVVVVALVAGIAFAVWPDKNTPDAKRLPQVSTPPSSSSQTTTTTTTTSSTPAGRPGSYETIADYIKNNGITEVSTKDGDPGAPTINLPIPDGWEALRPLPPGSYGAIVYSAIQGANRPTINAILSKLTGADPAQILKLAPGEVKNLPGYDGGDGEKDSLGGFDAYQLGGTFKKDGATLFVAQKTVVIPSPNGLFVLQLNATGPGDSQSIMSAATDEIDAKTTITV